MRIGVIAENPNDFVAIAKLLKKQYSDYEFFQLIKGFTGNQLDDKKNNIVLHTLINEVQLEQPDFLLYIRDLDDLLTNDVSQKIKDLNTRFKKFAKQKPKKSIFMLNIYELEAFILADFEVFKKHHKNTDWYFDSTTAADTHDPKSVLRSFTTYSEGQIKEILPNASLQCISENHCFFNIFMREFDKMLKNQAFKATQF
jgi:hypothetical protein